MAAPVHIVAAEDGWERVRYGDTIGNHRTKRTAKRAARREHRVGTSVYVHDASGRITEEFTIGGGDAGDDGGGGGGGGQSGGDDRERRGIRGAVWDFSERFEL